ncbi:hypothetical protein LINPERHAP2_LOCUS16756, partial [Linum perenne]
KKTKKNKKIEKKEQQLFSSSPLFSSLPSSTLNQPATKLIAGHTPHRRRHSRSPTNTRRPEPTPGSRPSDLQLAEQPSDFEFCNSSFLPPLLISHFRVYNSLLRFDKSKGKTSSLSRKGKRVV